MKSIIMWRFYYFFQQTKLKAYYMPSFVVDAGDWWRKATSHDGNIYVMTSRVWVISSKTITNNSNNKNFFSTFHQMVVREVLVTQNLFSKATENSMVRKTQNYIWSHSPELLLEALRGHGAEVTLGTHNPKKGMPVLMMPSGRTPKNLAVSLVPRFRCHLWDGLRAPIRMMQSIFPQWFLKPSQLCLFICPNSHILV